MLNSIGFLWDGKAPGTSTATWEEMYERLVAFKKEYNHTMVPRRYEGDKKLAGWVTTQRAVHKNKMMAEERRHLLDSIVFVWDGSAPGTSTATWEEMYQRLVAYRKKHNDTRVPQIYKEDPQLGTWVMNQRATYRKKKMTEERKCLLNSIGFVLDPMAKTATWEEMYQRLVAYKKEHNDTKVPRRYKEFKRHLRSSVIFSFL